MKASKKLLGIILCFIVVTLLCNSVVVANDKELNIGDYIVVGEYNNLPILWRYVVNDDNGMLMVSDKILDYKRYSTPQKQLDLYDVEWYKNSAYWAVSNLRAWLNSEADSGNVEWLDNNPPTLFGGNGYEDEAGFLNRKNFSEKEKQLFKEVTQWTMLRSGDVDLSENGLQEAFCLTYPKPGGGNGRDATGRISVPYDISEIPNIYYGAAMQTTDKMFLLDELQLYKLWKNFGDADADYITGSVPDNIGEYKYGYKLRDGYGYWYNNTGLDVQGSRYVGGVRPAFYLNEDAIETMTGSGTLEDPYVLNGESANVPETKSVTVTVDNETLEFDVEPVIENDRVLVPMRRIFETLGADVDWDDETKTAIASKGETQVKLQIGNNEMQTNGETVLLDAAPILLNDRTLVPIRAVSESLNANVDWDEENRQVVITTNN